MTALHPNNLSDEAPTFRHMLRREAGPALLLVLAAVLFFRNAVLLRGVFFHYDHALQNFPYRFFFARGLAKGTFPLWTSELFCGFPLFAESQANAAYPVFLLLFGFLKPEVAYNYYTVLHFAMAGVGTYALARTLSLRRSAALLAGICYMLSGPVLYHAHHTNIVVGVAWLPVLLALIELGFRRRTLPWFLGLGAGTGLTILGSQPQYTLYVGLTCAIYAGWRLFLVARSGEQRHGLLRLAGGLGAAVVIGVLLSAVQVLPTLELVARTSRGAAGVGGQTPGVPGNLLTLLLPFSFGSPGFASYWGATDPGLYSELTMFLGAGPLMLAVVGAYADRSRRTLFFVGLGLFAFIFSLGYHGSVYNIFGLLPVFRASRFPTRFAFVLALCTALLAGTGLQAVLYGRERLRVRRAAVVASVAVLGVGIAAIGLISLAQGDLPKLDGWELATRLPFIPSFDRQMIWRYLHDTFPWDVWRLAGATVTATGLLLLCVRVRIRPRVALALWCALVFAELAHAGREFAVVTDADLYTEPPRLVRALRDLPPGRVLRYRYYAKSDRPRSPADYPFTPGWALWPEDYAHCLRRLPPNSNLLWGVSSVSGFSPLQTVRLKALLGRPQAQSTLVEYNLSPPLDLLGVRYVLSPRWELPGDYQRIRSIGDINIFRNPGALPRAFIVHHGRAVAEEKDALRRLRSPSFDYRSEVLLHDVHAPSPAAGSGAAGPREKAELVADRGHEVVLRARLERPGYLVLADQHYPGWRVEVDGEPARLLRADYMLRAVRLGAGEHTVRFRYRPASFRLGAGLTALGLLLLAAGGVWCGVRPDTAANERPWHRSYSSGRGRFVLLVAALFLALGPAVRPGLWRDLPRQLTPRSYAAKFALLSARYAAADGQTERAWETARGACAWWPENPELRRQLARFTQLAANALLRQNRPQRARRMVSAALRLAPSELRRRAPALVATAGTGPPDDSRSPDEQARPSQRPGRAPKVAPRAGGSLDNPAPPQ
ncbi:MAG: YfhO family protein [Planctomycetota bacterium]